MLRKNLRLLLLIALSLFSLNMAMAVTNPTDNPDEKEEQTAGLIQEDLICRDEQGIDAGNGTDEKPVPAPVELETREYDCYWEYLEEKLGPFEGLADATPQNN